MSLGSEFRQALLERVLGAATENVTGVGDPEPWSLYGEWSNPPSARLRDAATRAGLRRVRFDVAWAARRLDVMLSYSEGFERTWQLLEDEGSRRLMLDVLARRILSSHHVALPVSRRRFRAIWQQTRARQVGTTTITGPVGVRLPLVEYRGIRLWADPVQLTAFELGQYEEAQPGEIVIDGGAGFGETALVFAQQVGATGRVVAVELDNENQVVIERNLALNPELAERITVVSGALWDTDGDELEYVSRGGASSILGTGTLARARTLTIDGLGLGHIDRIKLDVEGAEPHALRGAALTLARDRPRLAVAVYHRDDDLAVLPPLIHEIESSYRFRLGHFTPGIAETILVA